MLKYNRNPIHFCNLDKSILACIALVLSLSVGIIPAYAQLPNSRINWLEVCKSPMVDAVVSEPCETLTSPDGFTLTAKGQRVIGCFIGAAVLLAYDRTGTTLAAAQSIGKSAGVCEGMGSPSGSNPLTGVLGGLTKSNPGNSNPLTGILNGLSNGNPTNGNPGNNNPLTGILTGLSNSNPSNSNPIGDALHGLFGK